MRILVLNPNTSESMTAEIAAAAASAAAEGTEIVARNPRYRALFGVVSISDDYDSTSRQLMIKFLQTTRFDADLGRLVRAEDRADRHRAGLLVALARRAAR